MNLMFWKKKHDAVNDAEDVEGESSANKKAQEPIDSIAPKQGTSGTNPDSSEQESTVKIGLVVRMKSKFASLAQHFRKTPAFQAEEERATGTPGKSNAAPDAAAAQNPDSKPSDPEAPAKPGLATQIKLRFAALAARFKKTPTPEVEENQDKDAPQDSKDGEKTKEKHGIAAQIKSGLAALAARFKKASVPDAEEGKEKDQGKDKPRSSKGDSGGTEEGQVKPRLVAQIKLRLAAVVSRFRKAPESDAGEDQGKEARRDSKESQEGAEEAAKEPGRLATFFSEHKKHLMFILLFLLLAAAVYSAWDIIFPPLVRKPTPHYVPEVSIQKQAPQIQEPASQVQESLPQTQESVAQSGVATPQVEAEVLKKKSEEARARAEALKKESEEAQAQAETLKKESEVAQAKAEEFRKKQEEEKARAEALKKKSDEEKARAEALKRSNRQTESSATPPPISGEVAVGSNDPKTNVKSLKEAIELMNNDSGRQSESKAR